ncbi:MAG: hypothetical protein FWH34_08895 [Desulfovibrionaceae bacterium]|nr:hypothetical protein [Desulfovibrionaceae bacterium]
MEQNQPQYAACDICKQEMKPGNDCTLAAVTCGGKVYPRIKTGDKDDFLPNVAERKYCHDCNSAVGQYHHLGCDSERCPICRGQMFICDCELYYTLKHSH